MIETAFIYVLYDSRCRVPRYVGRTISPSLRLRSHVVSAINGDCNGNHDLQDWILALLREGIDPAIFIVEQTTAGRASRQEARWYKFFLRIEAPLLNSTKTWQHKLLFREVITRRSWKHVSA